MSNSEGKDQEKPAIPIQPKDVSQRQPDDHYETLMNEGKSVLDSIHIANAHNEGLFEGQRTKEQPPQVIVSEPLPPQDKSRMESEEEQAEQPDAESRNMGDMSSRNDTEQMGSMAKKSSKVLVGCNCIKSKCTKNYCQCFFQARKCTEICKCTGCENQGGEFDKRYRPNLDVQQGEKTCNCKKSNCLKKYCECYNSGVKCTSACKCEECRNCDDADDKDDYEDGKAQPKKVRSPEQLAEINAKIDQIIKLVPPEQQDYLLSFLEYWLS